MRPDPIAVPALDLAPQRYFARSAGRDFRSLQSDGATVIEIYDEVGPYGISASDISNELRGAGDVVLRINSPGGSVFDGLTAFNQLRAHAGHIRVEVLGVAASAASLIAMAGDEIAIADNAFLMLHRAWAGTIGNEQAHSETAAVLRQIDGALAKTYAARSGQPESAVKRMLNAETWLDANAAIEVGLADSKLETADVKAKFDLSIYANAPAALSAEIERADVQTIRDLEAALRDAGFSRSKARALAERGYHGEQEQRRDDAELAEIAALISAAANTIN